MKTTCYKNEIAVIIGDSSITLIDVAEVVSVHSFPAGGVGNLGLVAPTRLGNLHPASILLGWLEEPSPFEGVLDLDVDWVPLAGAGVACLTLHLRGLAKAVFLLSDHRMQSVTVAFLWSAL